LNESVASLIDFHICGHKIMLGLKLSDQPNLFLFGMKFFVVALIPEQIAL
jgi:hypothetical protein